MVGHIVHPCRTAKQPVAHLIKSTDARNPSDR
jgi:hypothetical protein